MELIRIAVWSYHRFNDSYRDVSERLLSRGIAVSYETIRPWCIKFGSHFKNVIKKRAPRPSDKWHLDEQQLGKGVEHRSHKGLNNRLENAHQPTCRASSRSWEPLETSLRGQRGTTPIQLHIGKSNFIKSKKFGATQLMRFFAPKIRQIYSFVDSKV
nr:IS6 family transposase [Legionella rowbothamii]